MQEAGQEIGNCQSAVMQSCSQYSVIQVPVLESQVPVPVPMSQVQVPIPVQVLENGTRGTHVFFLIL